MKYQLKVNERVQFNPMYRYKIGFNYFEIGWFMLQNIKNLNLDNLFIKVTEEIADCMSYVVSE
jgi:hypothetical protein